MLCFVNRRFFFLFKSRELFQIVPFKLADIGEGIKECEVLQWFVKQGDKIEEFDKLCEVQSDKAAVEITSRYTGKVVKLYKKPGEVVQVGSVLVDIDTETGKTETLKEKQALKTLPTKIIETVVDSIVKTDFNQYGKVLTTPSVRRMAREFKIDLTSIIPTGKNSRLLKSDVESHLSKSSTASLAGSTVYTPTAIQKAMFKSMTLSNSIPTFGYTDLLLMSSLEQQRDEINKSLPYKLSFMPFLIKAFGTACLEYPTVNASLKEDVIYKNSFVNVGIAMDTPNGLMVPNIKNVESKTILEIHQEMQKLLEKAKLNKLNMSDIKDTTFTLSNIGTIGGLFVNPVVPFGTSTIIGLGKLQYVQHPDVPEPKIVKAMPISLSADHRIVDGATSAKFVQYAKSLLRGGLVVHLK